MFKIGQHSIDGSAILAPMAGVTDLPFRQLCRQWGAALCVSEMITSDTQLWHSRKTQQRLVHRHEPSPRSVQIAGNEPQMMAEAARQNLLLGAEIIDINMGCPAKKVCKKAAGSALLQNEPLVEEILHAVVNAVDIPVTLKIRTGWDTQHKNAVTVAKIAEQAGIQALAVHGRTRACRFMGNAEYDTIAEVVDAVGIPVMANGDIRCAYTAQQVLHHTGAAAVMIGRGAQGNPWIFDQINRLLQTGEPPQTPSIAVRMKTVLEHIQAIHLHYGDVAGHRIARKHVGWYTAPLANGKTFCRSFNTLESTEEQLLALQQFLVEDKNWDQAA